MLENFKKYIGSNLVIWISLILLSSLYSQQNGGGVSYMLPFNVTVWLAVGLFVLFSLGRIVLTNKIVISGVMFWFFILLFSTYFIGLINSEISDSEQFVLFFLFLLVFLFVLSIYQYEISNNDFRLVLNLILLLGLVQALISIVQLFDSEGYLYSQFSYAPFKFYGQANGTFQQVNMLAVYLSLSLITAFYLFISSHSASVKWKIIPLLSTLLMAFILFSTSSRAGLLSLLLGLVMVVIGTKFFWKKQPSQVFVWIGVLFLGFILSYMIVDTGMVVNKLSKMAIGTDERLFLYYSGWSIFLQSSFIGIGIGNYPEALQYFVLKTGLPAQFSELDVKIFTHPHNEFLYWVLQSGIFVVVFALILSYSFYRAFMDVFTRYSIPIVALIIPLFLSAMVSLPFSLSGLHLFLLLFFLVLLIKEKNKVINFKVTISFKYFVFVLLIPLSIALSYFAWHTNKSSQEVFYFDNKAYFSKLETDEQLIRTRYLEHASFNVFYRDDSIKAMLYLADKALETGNEFHLLKFIEWANNQPLNSNNLMTVKMLQNVYLKLGYTDKANSLNEFL